MKYLTVLLDIYTNTVYNVHMMMIKTLKMNETVSRTSPVENRRWEMRLKMAALREVW